MDVKSITARIVLQKKCASMTESKDHVSIVEKFQDSYIYANTEYQNTVVYLAQRRRIFQRNASMDVNNVDVQSVEINNILKKLVYI